MVNSTLCPSDNTAAVEQGSFWNSNGLNWDTHRIGWLIAGCCAAVTVLLTLINVLQHARNYTNRAEQRQILRILYMPAVYAVISFFSYRYFRSYTYYSLIESAYESVTLSAFLLLLIEFVAATAAGHNIDNAIARKDKSPLPIPFCCLRYRPTKAYFMYTLKWSVLQYVIIRPVLSVVGIICQAKGILCESGPWSFKTANAYIEVIDAASITIALYGLILFYGLTREELKGRRPLAKFLSIKLIVMFTFYQGLVFDALEGRVIHATQYWTETNIADGLDALATCIEMVFFSAFMMFSFSTRDYKEPGVRTSIWRPLWDSINYSDFAVEIGGSLKFFVDFALHRPQTRGPRVTIVDNDGKPRQRANLGEAFGVESPGVPYGASESPSTRSRMSYDENIRLAPYTYASANATPAIGVDSPVSSAESMERFATAGTHPAMGERGTLPR
ncbi:hypothetical protein POSPLADRAFT_1065820 [Postia placenta MAD-698-R-SB12]|uniref:DUF300-domain-containing protein n=1 Tax=Postia placenta MAD-698-R-SB12 TaxID=670580 RepID=A0A1X6N1R7_9APHY|nr:hypothetical protein POSPLADRAFT_1065820 [Postia placenta MAD-698-R-SB12]OSX62559.1 hypothetical protein POSPLADRAFT_1065820 [Postia placenta MAD-698-R-SB12]